MVSVRGQATKSNGGCRSWPSSHGAGDRGCKGNRSETEQDAAGGQPRYQLVRALETAIAVCYWRSFTKSTIGRLDAANDGPSEETGLRWLHSELKRMRHNVYAHTDHSGGRDAGLEARGGDALVFTESWVPLPREWLPAVIALAEGQRDRFRLEADTIRRSLAPGSADESV